VTRSTFFIYIHGNPVYRNMKRSIEIIEHGGTTIKKSKNQIEIGARDAELYSEYNSKLKEYQSKSDPNGFEALESLFSGKDIKEYQEKIDVYKFKYPVERSYRLNYLVKFHKHMEDSGIGYLYEILIACMLDKHRNPKHIEYSLFSTGLSLHMFYTIRPEEGFGATLREQLQNGLIEMILEKHQAWLDNPESPPIIRSTIILGIRTFFFESDGRRSLAKIKIDGHAILLYIEINRHRVGNQIVFGVIDNLEPEDYVIPDFHGKLLRILKETYEAHKVVPSSDVVDMIMVNRFTGYMDYFSCMAISLRAALLLAFLEKPEVIISDRGDEKREEIDEIYKICSFHLERMVSWMLTNKDLRSGEFMLFPGHSLPIESRESYEISNVGSCPVLMVGRFLYKKKRTCTSEAHYYYDFIKGVFIKSRESINHIPSDICIVSKKMLGLYIA